MVPLLNISLNQLLRAYLISLSHHSIIFRRQHYRKIVINTSWVIHRRQWNGLLCVCGGLSLNQIRAHHRQPAPAQFVDRSPTAHFTYWSYSIDPSWLINQFVGAIVATLLERVQEICECIKLQNNYKLGPTLSAFQTNKIPLGYRMSN